MSPKRCWILFLPENDRNHQRRMILQQWSYYHQHAMFGWVVTYVSTWSGEDIVLIWWTIRHYTHRPHCKGNTWDIPAMHYRVLWRSKHLLLPASTMSFFTWCIVKGCFCGYKKTIDKVVDTIVNDEWYFVLSVWSGLCLIAAMAIFGSRCFDVTNVDTSRMIGTLFSSFSFFNNPHFDDSQSLRPDRSNYSHRYDWCGDYVQHHTSLHRLLSAYMTSIAERHPWFIRIMFLSTTESLALMRRLFTNIDVLFSDHFTCRSMTESINYLCTFHVFLSLFINIVASPSHSVGQV